MLISLSEQELQIIQNLFKEDDALDEKETFTLEDSTGFQEMFNELRSIIEPKLQP